MQWKFKALTIELQHFETRVWCFDHVWHDHQDCKRRQISLLFYLLLICCDFLSFYQHFGCRTWGVLLEEGHLYSIILVLGCAFFFKITIRFQVPDNDLATWHQDRRSHIGWLIHVLKSNCSPSRPFAWQPRLEVRCLNHCFTPVFLIIVNYFMQPHPGIII